MRRSFFAILLALTTAGAACSSSDDNGSAPAPGDDGGGSSGSSGTSGSSGGTPEGGSSAEAGPDAATDADAAAADPCKDRTVCDSFESFAVGGKPGAPWSPQENSGTVTVSDARAHTGTHSLKLVTTPAGYQEAMIQLSGAPLFPLTNNTLYGKM